MSAPFLGSGKSHEQSITLFSQLTFESKGETWQQREEDHFREVWTLWG